MVCFTVSVLLVSQLQDQVLMPLLQELAQAHSVGPMAGFELIGVSSRHVSVLGLYSWYKLV